MSFHTTLVDTTHSFFSEGFWNLEPKLIKDGSKILSIVVENFHFLDSFNYLPMSLKSMPKSFDLTCKKGYYPTSSTRPAT